MRYIFRKVWLKLLHHRLVYGLLVLEMAIGMALYVYSCNLLYSMQDEQTDMEQAAATHLMRIFPQDHPSVSEQIPVNADDYKHIQRLVKQGLDYFIVIPDIIISDEKIIDYNLLLVDFQKYGLDPGCVYAGQEIQNEIERKGIMVGIEEVSIEQKEMILQSEENLTKHFEIMPLPNSLKEESLMGSAGNTGFADSLLIPVTEMDKVAGYVQSGQGSVELGIDLSGSSDDEAVLQNIEQYLKERHGESYSYEFYSPSAEFENDTFKAQVDINSINKMGILMLVTLSISFICIFKMLLRKREQELGICQACGAADSDIMAETFIEIFSICIVGIGIGCVTGFILTYQSSSFFTEIVEMKGDFRTVIHSFLFCLLIAIVIFVSVMQKYYFGKTIELIRDK